MAGRGPAPKPAGARVRMNNRPEPKAPSHPVGAPPPDGSWSPAVVRWYEVWANSPQSAVFLTTDWQRLHMLAPLVGEYFAEPSVKLMTEIRLQESLMGATPVDRLRLNLPADPPTPQRQDPTPPRRRTLKAVPDSAAS